MCPSLPVADSWSEWSEWSDCDSSGFQFRARQCIILFPVGSQCTGNTTESRACALDSNFIPGEISLLLEESVKSLSVSGARCNTVPVCPVQSWELEQNLPFVSQSMFAYYMEPVSLDLVSSWKSASWHWVLWSCPCSHYLWLWLATLTAFCRSSCPTW